jgi:hypothetical protein
MAYPVAQVVAAVERVDPLPIQQEEMEILLLQLQNKEKMVDQEKVLVTIKVEVAAVL